MIISQWKNGDRTFFSLEVDDRLLLIYVARALLEPSPFVVESATITFTL